nr:hypothetical protein [Providencia rettgeri]
MMNDTAWAKVVSNNSLVERAVAVGDGGMTGVGEVMGGSSCIGVLNGYCECKVVSNSSLVMGVGRLNT